MLRLLWIMLLAGLLATLSACQTTSPVRKVPAWQSPRGHEQADVGVIRDMSSGRELTPQQLAERLAQAPRVLVGEQHDNPDHHALQLWLLQVLADQRAQGRDRKSVV